MNTHAIHLQAVVKKCGTNPSVAIAASQGTAGAMMHSDSSLFEEILDRLTGAQRQRIRAVLAAEHFDRLTIDEMRVLVDRISDETALTPPFMSSPWRGSPSRAGNVGDLGGQDGLAGVSLR